jgi:hypothetical protein
LLPKWKEQNVEKSQNCFKLLASHQLGLGVEFFPAAIPTLSGINTGINSKKQPLQSEFKTLFHQAQQARFFNRIDEKNDQNVPNSAPQVQRKRFWNYSPLLALLLNFSPHPNILPVERHIFPVNNADVNKYFVKYLHRKPDLYVGHLLPKYLLNQIGKNDEKKNNEKNNHKNIQLEHNPPRTTSIHHISDPTLNIGRQRDRNYQNINTLDDSEQTTGPNDNSQQITQQITPQNPPHQPPSSSPILPQNPQPENKNIEISKTLPEIEFPPDLNHIPYIINQTQIDLIRKNINSVLFDPENIRNNPNLFELFFSHTKPDLENPPNPSDRKNDPPLALPTSQITPLHYISSMVPYEPYVEAFEYHLMNKPKLQSDTNNPSIIVDHFLSHHCSICSHIFISQGDIYSHIQDHFAFLSTCDGYRKVDFFSLFQNGSKCAGNGAGGDTESDGSDGSNENNENNEKNTTQKNIRIQTPQEQLIAQQKYQFHCNYCLMSFQTRTQFNQHQSNPQCPYNSSFSGSFGLLNNFYPLSKSTPPQNVTTTSTVAETLNVTQNQPVSNQPLSKTQ